MGLLYQFPINADENEYFKEEQDKKEMRSYGLPLIFWGYALAILLAMSFMFLGAKAPINKMLQMEWWGDQLIGYLLITFFILGPLAMISFFFYEKVLILTNHQLTIEHKLFGICFNQKSYQLKTPFRYQIDIEMDSPNMAKMMDEEGTKGFQNKGYFRLKTEDTQGKLINIDRSSSKADLLKTAELFFK